MNELDLYKKIKALISYSDKYVISSFPKIHTGIKIKFQDNLFSLLENCIRANVNNGNIRNKYQKEMIINIYLLDYYIEEIMKREIIKTKRYSSFINKLNVINKMIYGWINSEESK